MVRRGQRLVTGLLALLGCVGFSGRAAVEIDANLPAAENAQTVPLSRFAWTDPAQGRTHYAIIEVSASGIRFDSAPVVSLTGGVVAETDRKGLLIAGLYDALSTHRSSGEVLLVIDAAVPYQTTKQVLYTAGQAQLSTFFFMVDDADAPAWSAPTAGGTQIPARVQISGDGGLAVVDGSSVAPTSPDTLGQALRAASQEHDGVSCVALAPAPSAPWSSVAGVIDVMSGDEELMPVIAAGSGEHPGGGASLPPGVPRQLQASAEVAVLQSRLPSIAPAARTTPAPGTCLNQASLIGAVGTQIGSGQSTSRQPVAVEREEPTIEGPLDKASVDATVTRYMNQLQYCYQRTLNKEPDIQGRIAVTFVVARDGSVSSAETASTMGSAEVETCIRGRFMRFTFPAPDGDEEATVTQPLLFRPG